MEGQKLKGDSKLDRRARPHFVRSKFAPRFIICAANNFKFDCKKISKSQTIKKQKQNKNSRVGLSHMQACMSGRSGHPPLVRSHLGFPFVDSVHTQDN